MGKASGLPATLEPVGLDRGDGKRPDGISLYPFSQGRPPCWDATCTNTYADSFILDSAVEAGAAAAKAEESKRIKYPELVRRFRFEPIRPDCAVTLRCSEGGKFSRLFSV